MKFTLERFIEANNNGTLKELTIEYLLTEGKNKHLADHLSNNKIIWVDLIEYPLRQLRREMGYEGEGLVFSENKEQWDQRVGLLKNDIQQGYTPPPLIATDFWDDVHLADGSHRHEAFVQLNWSKYWTIFFIKNEANKKIILDMNLLGN
jgi:hypothetical protein